MRDSGLSAMIRTAAQLTIDFPGLEVITLGGSETNVDAEAELQLGGRWLLFRILLCGEIRLSVALMDGVENPQTILRSPDTAAGWSTTHKLIAAMETHEVRSLQRPIEVGPPVPDTFVIG